MWVTYTLLAELDCFFIFSVIGAMAGLLCVMDVASVERKGLHVAKKSDEVDRTSK